MRTYYSQSYSESASLVSTEAELVAALTNYTGLVRIAPNTTIEITTSLTEAECAGRHIVGSGGSTLSLGSSLTKMFNLQNCQGFVMENLTLNGGTTSDQTVSDPFDTDFKLATPTAAPGLGDDVAIDLRYDCQRNRFVNLDIINFDSTGVLVRNSTVGSGGAGTFSGCFFENNYYGVRLSTRGEYLTFVNCQARYNKVGIHCEPGNITFSGVSADYNVAGMVFTTGTNDSHTTWQGGTCNHNSKYSVFVFQIQRGLTLGGLQIHAGPIRLVSAKGAYFNGCEIGVPLELENPTSDSLELTAKFADCMLIEGALDGNGVWDVSETTQSGEGNAEIILNLRDNLDYTSGTRKGIDDSHLLIDTKITATNDGNVDWDLDSGETWTITLDGDNTLNLPSNMPETDQSRIVQVTFIKTTGTDTLDVTAYTGVLTLSGTTSVTIKFRDSTTAEILGYGEVVA